MDNKFHVDACLVLKIKQCAICDGFKAVKVKRVSSFLSTYNKPQFGSEI